MADEVKLPVPLQFRRGVLRKDEPKSVAQGVNMLARISQVRPIEGARILDFGCGVKTAQALFQLENPHQLYVGLDVYREMIEFLQTRLSDYPSYKFASVPFQNDMYNQHGEPMRPDSSLPIDDKDFDLMFMFSVITHMQPDDTAATLSILRRYAAADCRLFFWAFASDDHKDEFRDIDPEHPLRHAVYRKGFLDQLIQDSGWRIAEARLGKVRQKWFQRQTHYVCAPA